MADGFEDGGGIGEGCRALTYRVTSYYKREKDKPGLTQAGSIRLDALGALQWIVNDLPEAAVRISHDDDPIVRVEIDQTLIPPAAAR